MSAEWIEYRSEWGVCDSMPPCCKLSWFYSEGNMRDPYPHVRLAMPALENTSDASYWMPHAESSADAAPEPPRKEKG